MPSRPRVLSEADLTWFKAINGPKWMGKWQYKKRQRASYYQALDDQVEMLAKFGYHDPLEGETLRELLAIAISKDGTFGPFFRDEGAQDLETEAGWKRLWSVCAGRVVEKYLGQRDEPAPSGPSYVLPPTFAESISELVSHAVAAGELSAAAGRAAGEDFLIPPGKPELVEEARAALEELLATDINLVAEADDEDDIPTNERELEISKSALLRLRTGELKKIAEEEDLPLVRDRESLATTIARKYNASRGEIAELILGRLQDNPETGHSTHLIPLVSEPDLATARSRLADLQGHYLRLEVAHWLVFGESEGNEEKVSFGGEMRYYDVAAQREGGEAEIAARRRKAAVEVRLRKGVRWAEIDGRNLTEIRRLRSAFGRALDVKTQPSLPVEIPALEGVAATLDRNTLLMLRILETGLRDEFVDYASFTAADFAKPKKAGTEADPLRPSVRQVKLLGQHILSSPEACRLIVKEGQRMATVEFRARYKENLKGPSHFSSVKISLATDQATVMTSFGGEPKISRRLHDEIVKRLRKAIDRGVKEAVDLNAIVSQVVARADETGEVETADIFPPDGGDGIAATEIDANGAAASDANDDGDASQAKAGGEVALDSAAGSDGAAPTAEAD
jgi:hypothetical protein